MKNISKIIVSLFCAAFIAVPVLFSACNGTDNPGDTNEPEVVDYVSDLKLDLTSETKKQEVTVRLYVDGDTTHFDPVLNSKITPNTDLSAFNVTQNYIKARYIAINTPESTGKIEKWGKTASNFTHDKLESAESIIVESDDNNWNADSTGARFVLWVWYKPKGETEYRNLNVEILQEGFAIMSNTAGNRYGQVAYNALNQAKALKLHVYSPASTVDVNYYEGDAITVTLKELRCHADDYLQKLVRVTGVVVAYFDNTIYIQEYDAEDGIYYGMTVFDGYQTGPIIGLFKMGNEVTVVGNITEFQGTYQISGVSYNPFEPDNTNNSVKISEGNEIDFTEVSAKDIISGKIDVEFYDEDSEKTETVNMNYAEAIMSTAVTVNNLKVTRTSTTNNGGNNDGAISLRCTAADGTQITVRTTVLKENGVTVTADRFANKTINVKGVIEKYVPDSTKPDEYYYQVKCYRLDFIDITG